jgi:hypothetical protein
MCIIEFILLHIFPHLPHFVYDLNSIFQNLDVQEMGTIYDIQILF